MRLKGLAERPYYPADKTAELLEKIMGLELVAKEGDFSRFHSSAKIGNIIDLKQTPIGRGQMGAGTVHHIARRAVDDQDQLDWQICFRKWLSELLLNINYFNAIYLENMEKVYLKLQIILQDLHMIKSLSTMGGKLRLPQQYEQFRERIEQVLIPIKVRELD